MGEQVMKTMKTTCFCKSSIGKYKNSKSKRGQGGLLPPSDNHGTLAIGNPERHVRKASHCGSKQQ